VRALILSAGGFEDCELLFPFYRLKEEGIEVDLAAVGDGVVTGEHGYAIRANLLLPEVDAQRYALLVLPGGKAAQAVRRSGYALAIVESFFKLGRPVAAICHGAQVLAWAGVLKGRRATCHPRVAAELKHAGAIYEDSEVVVDGNLVTSRRPEDLPAFMRETLRLLRGRAAAAGQHSAAAA